MTERRGALWVAAVHLAVASYHVAVSGVVIAERPWLSWDNLWQVLPIGLLDHALVRSLWNLHMQPPLWNLLGAVAHRLVGDDFESALHVLHVVLGTASAALVYLLVRRTTARPGWALAVGLLVALDPALVLYEAYALYSMLVAFLVVLTCFLVAQFERRRRIGWLLAALAALELLVLTRSSYTPLLLLPAAAAIVALAPRPHGRSALLALLVCLPTLGWVGKNVVLFGVAGTSSWLGQNVWRLVASNYSRDELRALAAAGVVAPVAAELPAFSLPSAYRRWGFERRAGVPELDGDQHNNLNEVEISRAYGRSAWRLLRHDPLRAARGSARAFYLYTAPTSRYSQLAENRRRLGWHERIYSGWLLGDDWLRLPDDRGHSGAVFMLLLVAAAVAAGRRLRDELRAAGIRGAEWARSHPTLVALAGFALYNLVVSCTLDLGENERFRFEVEPVYWTLFAWSFAGRREPA